MTNLETNPDITRDTGPIGRGILMEKTFQNSSSAVSLRIDQMAQPRKIRKHRNQFRYDGSSIGVPLETGDQQTS